MKYLYLLCTIFIVISCGQEKKSTNEAHSKDSLLVQDSNQAPPPELTPAADEAAIKEQEELMIESGLVEWDNTVRVYIHDPDTLPTNVRDSPRGKIILKLAKGSGYEVALKGVDNGWFLIELIVENDGEERIFKDVGGYIHGSVLGADPRNYEGEDIPFYDGPGEDYSKIYSLAPESIFTLVDANEDGSWFKVRVKSNGSSIEGWVESGWLCGSLRTNCS